MTLPLTAAIDGDVDFDATIDALTDTFISASVATHRGLASRRRGAWTVVSRSTSPCTRSARSSIHLDRARATGRLDSRAGPPGSSRGMNPTATAKGGASFEAQSGLPRPKFLSASRCPVNALRMGSPLRAFAGPISFRTCRGIHPAVRLGVPARESGRPAGKRGTHVQPAERAERVRRRQGQQLRQRRHGAERMQPTASSAPIREPMRQTRAARPSPHPRDSAAPPSPARAWRIAPRPRRAGATA